MFKEWARVDLDNSSLGAGFEFTAIAYSDGRPDAASNKTDYQFSIDPERANGRHLYTVWSRLQTQEVEALRAHQQEVGCRRARRSTAGLHGTATLGSLLADPWIGGQSQFGNAVGTPHRGTLIGPPGVRSDLRDDRVAEAVRTELEGSIYSAVSLVDRAPSRGLRFCRIKRRRRYRPAAIQSERTARNSRASGNATSALPAFACVPMCRSPLRISRCRSARRFGRCCIPRCRERLLLTSSSCTSGCQRQLRRSLGRSRHRRRTEAGLRRRRQRARSSGIRSTRRLRRHRVDGPRCRPPHRALGCSVSELRRNSAPLPSVRRPHGHRRLTVHRRHRRRNGAPRRTDQALADPARPRFISPLLRRDQRRPVVGSLARPDSQLPRSTCAGTNSPNRQSRRNPAPTRWRACRASWSGWRFSSLDSSR